MAEAGRSESPRPRTRRESWMKEGQADNKMKVDKLAVGNKLMDSKLAVDSKMKVDKLAVDKLAVDNRTAAGDASVTAAVGTKRKMSPAKADPKRFENIHFW
jgi:hypothetical protein